MTSETLSYWLVELSHMQSHVGLFCKSNYPMPMYRDWKLSLKRSEEGSTLDCFKAHANHLRLIRSWSELLTGTK